METHSNEYKKHLENKYLPGRRYYLKWFFYPKLFNEFKNSDAILDLGCGTGEFLNYCRSRERQALGVDSNEYLVRSCQEKGFNVQYGDISKTMIIKELNINNLICDNVLEHMPINVIEDFFENIRTQILKGGTIIIIVPCEKGYQRDPTHKTFLNLSMIQSLCEKFQLTLDNHYFHPFNSKWIGKHLYLNMQVYVLKA